MGEQRWAYALLRYGLETSVSESTNSTPQALRSLLPISQRQFNSQASPKALQWRADEEGKSADSSDDAVDIGTSRSRETVSDRSKGMPMTQHLEGTEVHDFHIPLDAGEAILRLPKPLSKEDFTLLGRGNRRPVEAIPKAANPRRGGGSGRSGRDGQLA